MPLNINMKIYPLILLSVVMVLHSVADTKRPLSLLSDNVSQDEKSALYANGTPVIRTGATYSFVTDGEFATCKGSLKSAADNGGVKILFDGKEWWKSQTFGDWDGGKWVTVIVDLQTPYLVGKIDVRALREAMRDTQKAYVLFSLDGKEFTQYGVAENTTDKPAGKGSFIELNAQFEKPVLARYAQIRIEKARHQQQISEIAIWGWKLEENSEISYFKVGQKPCVTFDSHPIQDGAASISWTRFSETAPDATAWKIYYSKNAFTNIHEAGVSFFKQFTAKQTTSPLYPFEPGSTVFFGITGVYAGGESPDVNAIPILFKTPFERNTFGDMLAINHFVGGGAPNRGKAWIDVTLDMLAETPFTESRWWFMFPDTVKMFLDRDIGLICWPAMSKDPIKNNLKNANSFGLHSFTKGNEPELNGIKPEVYLENLKIESDEAKRMSKWNTIGAPTCNIWPTALDWLEEFYRVGAKDYFDVLDLHTYTTPPENLFGRIKTVRGIMAKYGDENKPMISTEYGYADTPKGPEGVSPLVKAQYLVRGLIIHYILDFKRVYVYSFADIGTDPYNNEHHFGLLDYDLQKKPAYYAVCNLGKQLGDCTLVGEIPGIKAPSYGYQFKSTTSPDYVAVVWNGEEERLGTFSTTSGTLEIADLFGKMRSVVLGDETQFSLTYGASPVFIRSQNPVKLLSSEKQIKTASSSDANLSLNLIRSNIFVRENVQSTQVEFAITNGTEQAISGSVTVKTLNDVLLGKSEIAVEAQSDYTGSVLIELAFPADTALVRYKLHFNYISSGSTFSEEKVFTLRQLTGVPNGVTTSRTHFQDYANDIYVLANDKIEVSFDPKQGGRVLELIDRKTLTNQIRIDYDLIPTLASIAYDYAIWFKFNGEMKNAPWEIASTKDGTLKLQANNIDGKVAACMDWSINPGESKLTLNVQVSNLTDVNTEAKFYMHPEYHVSGQGKSGNDIFLLPTDKGVFKLPFWIDLGERQTPELTENWWAVFDSTSNLELKQEYSAGWNPPRIWFGGGWYNVEMSRDFTLAPKENAQTSISWSLGQHKDEK